MAGSHFIVAPHDATGSAARSAIAFHLRALSSQVPGAEKGAPDAVHELRIATRRLRAAVQFFAPYISAIKPKDIEERLKWLGRQAGAVRDLDVLEMLLQKRAAKLQSDMAKDLAPLFEELQASRKKAADALASALISRRYKSLVASLSAPIAITAQGDEAFGSVAGDLFAPMLKSVLRAGERMHEEPTPDDLHRVRKRAKRARYALETMLGIGKKRLGRVLEGLEDLQELLGRYHDAAVAIDWVKKFANSRELPLNVAFACGALTESIERKERELRRRGLKQWRRFVQDDSERKLGKALEKIQPKGASPDAAVHHAPRPRRGSNTRG